MSAPRRKPGRPKGSTRDPIERRADLLAAAERAIREHGPGVSMEQIADEAGVAKATLYDNFDGKSGLTDALLERYGTRVLSTIARGLDLQLTAHDVLRGGIEVFVAVIERDLDLYRFVLIENGSRTMLDESAPAVTALLASMLRQAGSDPTGAEAMARALLGGIFAAAEWWSEQQTMSRADFVNSLDELLWPGLAAAGIDRLTEPVDLSDIGKLLDELDPVDTGPTRTTTG
jgi:AcrR family transcriptional regulator